MKWFDIAIKDLLRSFRSSFLLGMMVVAPLLMTGLIYLAFGGLMKSSDQQLESLPKINLIFVNEDVGHPNSDFLVGDGLISAFQEEPLASLFVVQLAAEESAARQAVDRQEAAVALVIPENFTRAALLGEGKAAVLLYQDPTLTFGPGLTREVVEQYLDAFSGGQIAGAVLVDQLTAHGTSLELAAAQQAQVEYGFWLQSLQEGRSLALPIEQREPVQTESAGVNPMLAVIGSVMAGMMIFFVFFGGAGAAQSFLTEQEEGTLARLFTTPTPLRVILGGKFAAIFLTLAVQCIVLIVVSGLLFGIQWGNVLSLALLVVGLVVGAAGFGIFLLSLIKNNRQAGPVISGTLMVTGMVGGLMSTGFDSLPEAFETAGLFVPQGWALRGMKLAMSGVSPQEVVLPLLVLLAFGGVFFTLGARMFQKRFA
jgi:ABC-2 type transport system permease protein